MSNYLIKGETLTSVANAIREKTGSSEKILISEMLNGISQLTKPNGEIEITENGSYNVSEKASAIVNVPIPEGYIQPSGAISITKNGTYVVNDKDRAVVNVPIPDGYIQPSGTLEITENGSYNIADKASATVNVQSGLTINGIIKQYKVQANKTVNAGDFVEFVKAVSWGSGTFNSGSSNYIHASKLNDSSALVVYQDVSNSNYGKAIVLSISDSGISIGAETAFNSAATSFIGLCVLSDTKALVVFRDEGNSNQGTAVVLTISGTAITVGTKYVYDSGVAGMNFVTALNDSKAIVFYIDYSDSNKSKAIVLSINETTITKGSETVIDSGKSYSYYPSAVALNDSQVLLTYASKSNSEYGTAVVLTISGTSISIGTKTVFKSATTHYCSTVLLNTNKVLVTYLAGGNGTAQILTVSGNSITVEAETVFNSGISYYISTTALSDTKALVTYQDYNNSKYGTAIVLSVNGTTVTAGEKLVFNKATTTYSCPAVLSSSSAVVFANSGGYKGLSIDGTTITLNSEVKSEILVRASEGVINGVAKTGGSSGETVEVYVKE